MKSFVDDPRLTAYALGEVDEAERAEVESLLKRSPDARRWVESVQQTSARLSAELKHEMQGANYELGADVESRSSRAPSASAGLEQSTDSRTNRSLALPALKGRRIVRLIPLAVAASVAVASGVTYVAWKQSHDEKVASLKCITCLNQIGHGLGQYRYDDDSANPTVALADSTVSKQGDAASNMRTGLVQVTPVDGKSTLEDLNSDGQPEILNGMPLVFGEAVTEDFDPDEPIVYEPDTDTVVIEGRPRVVDPTAHDIVGIELTNLVSNVDLDGSAADAAVPIDTDADGQSDSSTAQAFAMAGLKLNTKGNANSSGSQLWHEKLRYPSDSPTSPLAHGAVETMDYDASDTGAVSPEDFALAVDSLDGSIYRYADARFTSGGYDFVDHKMINKGSLNSESPPQIGLKAKPNMDLRAAAVRDKMYVQQRAALIEYSAPGNGQSVFGGSSGVEVMQPQLNSQNRDNESLNADLNYTAGTTATGTTTEVENLQFRDLGTVATTLNSTSWSGADDALPVLPAGSSGLNATLSNGGGPSATGVVATGPGLNFVAPNNFWVLARQGDVTVKQFISPSASDDVVGFDYDFTSYPNISYGYEVPFGPPSTVPRAGFYLRDPTTAESYDPVIEIPFLFVENQPLSTFSIDVDTASYTNVRRMLNQNVLPPHGAVRVEEMVNYFDYDYPPPTGADPFSVNVAVAECPWNPEHRLARIGIKGKVFTDRNRPAANLVFLVDVSGSMQDANKLPLVRHGLRAMVEQLTPRDSVAIVTYADGSNVALPATSARNKQTILDAVNRLMSGGGTNGGAGIETAYQLANEHYVEGGANRVILATDGDFNVGVTRQDELVSMIEEKAATGVFLSVLGFGMGNIKDSMLEKLADKGNGLYAYIDDDVEAERVLVDQMGGTLVTIAKDVKIQVEFNPAEVGAYRLIGYENRMLRAQDFNNDAKDAGEIGAGHTVTALYEIVPAGMQAHEPGVDPLKYQGGEARAAGRDEVPAGDTDMVEVDEAEEGTEVVDTDETETTEPRPQGSGQRTVETLDVNVADGGQSPPYPGELMTVKLRYKDPEGDVSKLIELPVTDGGLTIDDASDDFVFAASVASFGMMLRGSANTPDLSFDFVLEMARSSMGEDPFGYREEFIQLVEKAKTLSTPKQK